jgi:hypothetical protein
VNRSVLDSTVSDENSRLSGNLPRCVFVSGPRGGGKTRWLQERILALVAEQPGIRCAVVLAEDGRTRMERFAHDVSGVAVRRVFLPCPCCPARADLPATARQLALETNATWLFVEVPATAAAGLLAEFDRELGWPREVIVCLTEKWADLCRRPDSPLFLSTLLARADRVVRMPPLASGPAPEGPRSVGSPDLILT